MPDQVRPDRKGILYERPIFREGKMRVARVGAAILVLLLANLVYASDWPQYLGPNRNAVSDEKGLMRSWPANGPKVLWTIPLGEGFGGPAVSEGKVYVYDRVAGKENILRCIDLETGREEWTFSHEVPGSFSHNGSRSVPTIDGNRIYICDPFGNLHCLDKNSHRVIWHKNIWTDFGGTKLPRWAIAQNPLIFENRVILASQTEKAGVVAYDKLTGDLLWTTPQLPGRPGYVTPTLVKIGGEDHLVMISADGVTGFDPRSGASLWTYDGWKCRIPVPNVTEIGDDRLFVTGGYNAGSAIIRIEKQGDKYVVKELLRSKEFGTHVHPPVLYKDHLYGHCSTNDVLDGMVSMDLNGTVKWKTKKAPLFERGGFILADDMIISVDGKKGNLYLIEPTPAGFKQLAKAKLLDTKESWAPLALSDGKLLIRDQKQLKCILLK